MAELVEHKGVVESVEGFNARVRIIQVSACSGCHARSGCMAADQKTKYIDCQTEEQLNVGDEVIVQIAQSVAWQAVLISFVIPFVLLVIMIWGLGLYFTEAVSGTLAIVSVLVYYGIVALFRGKLKKRFKFIARK